MTVDDSRARIDLYRRRHPGREPDALRHRVDLDADRDPLREAHPREGRVYRRDPLSLGLRVRDARYGERRRAGRRDGRMDGRPKSDYPLFGVPYLPSSPR
jgi:hypothetical protein